MIRTHRPRGHAWNCASVFQQTPEFRHIDLDECQPPQDEILGPDPQNEWTLVERTAKRQRIEKLADDFLNGFQLHIHSARLDPQRFKQTLALSFPRPRDARIAVEEIVLENDSTSTWEDVDDDREVLRAHAAARRRSDVESTTVVGDDSMVVHDEPATMIEVQVQASCRPKRNLRFGRVTTGPSEEALRKAAELRNRRLRRSALDPPSDSQTQSCPRPVISETQDQDTESSLCETASDCGPTPTPAWTSSKWIKTGALQLRKKGVDEDCSKDELGATSMFSPSQRCRARTRALARAALTTSNQSQTCAPPISSATTDMAASCTAGRSVPETDSESFVSAPSNLAIPETSNPSKASPEPDGQEGSGAATSQRYSIDTNSQAALLRRQGVHVSPRKSWAAVNDTQAEGGQNDDDDAEQNGLPPSSSREPHTEPAQLNCKPSKGRQTKSTGDAVKYRQRNGSTRRQSAPLESEDIAKSPAGVPSESRQHSLQAQDGYTTITTNGASPFVFRKRAAKARNSGGPEQEPTSVPRAKTGKTPRKKMVFPSSDSPHQLAPAPDTPLANEHLNRILPQETISNRRSSATRRALRAELRASGAEISRCANDPTSSQGESTSKESQSQADGELDASHDEHDGQHDPTPQPHVQSQVPWAGTQDQLALAYKNLFTSPDKTNTALYLGDSSTPDQTTEKGEAGRKPLRQLSQEPMPMPSTQALLDGWEGWSTIKKPRPVGKRPNLVQSPTAGKRQDTISSDPAQHMETANRRRSSLRYSMSYTESPGKAQPRDDTTLDIPRLDTPRLEKDSSGFVTPAAKRSSGGVASSLSFGFSTLDLPTTHAPPKESATLSKTLNDLSFGATMSSYQNAQRQPDIDSQELDVMTTQLADDVLTTGVETLMSQTRDGSF